MLNALEKVMYPNGKTKALGDITSGSVSSIIDEVHTNTSAISAINSKLEHLTYDSETEKYNMSSGLNVRWHLVAQHHLRANDFDLGENNAGFRNSIYRGKNLGTSVTAEQWDSIESGTFDNMFIGDYWTINGVKWRIAGFDYFLNAGNPLVTDHHMVIVPDENLLAADGATTKYMNVSDTSTGGYKSSGYFSGTNSDSTPNTAKADCVDLINTAFGAGHILSHTELITSAIADGKASAWAWDTCTVECMSEVMLCGEMIWGMSGYETGTNVTQLPLFFLNRSLINNGSNYWARSIKSATDFVFVGTQGMVNNTAASSAGVGIRPCFALYNPTTQQTNTRKKASKKKGE